MVINELRKIYSPRILLLLAVVGCVLFYSWVIGQMNLSHLPLFETVEAELGSDFTARYGVTWEDAELSEIRDMAKEKTAALNRRVTAAYPALCEMGFDSWEELNTFLSSDGEQGSLAEGYTMEDARDLQQEIYLKCEREILEKEYYCMIASDAEAGDSVLPPSVFANMKYALGDYFRILMYMVWILVLPFLAADNMAGIRQVSASCRYGRKLIVKQMTAVVLAVLLLVTASGCVLYAVCRLYTPFYDPFYACPVPGIWPDWTFGTYLVMKVAVVSGAALGLALVFFFLSSFCRTIVGTVVMAIPCWGIGELLSSQVFGYLFQMPEKGRGASFYMDWLARFEYFPQVLCATLILTGLVLCGILVSRRKTEDVME